MFQDVAASYQIAINMQEVFSPNFLVLVNISAGSMFFLIAWLGGRTQ